MPRGSAPFPPAGRREVPALPSAARSRGAPFPSAWGSQADAAGINGATDAGLTPSSAAVPGSVVATIPDDRLFTILRAAEDAPRVEARDQPPRRVLQREAFVVGGGRLRRGQLFRGAGERVGQEARTILPEGPRPRSVTLCELGSATSLELRRKRPNDGSARSASSRALESRMAAPSIHGDLRRRVGLGRARGGDHQRFAEILRARGSADAEDADQHGHRYVDDPHRALFAFKGTA